LEEDGEAATEPLVVSTSTGHLGRPPSVSWTGSEFGVVWEGSYSSWAADITFARISSTGELVGSPLRLTDGTDSWNPQLQWTGSEFGVAWFFGDEIYFMRLDALGGRSSEPIMVSHVYIEYSEILDVAWTGSEFGIVWMEGLDMDSTIGFGLVDQFGQKKGSSIQVTEERNSIYAPDLAWSGSEFGVVWTDSRDGDPTCRETPTSHCRRETYFNRIGLCD
jgi:hypothetical protein